MKMYKVNVNGTVYEVSIEVMDGVPAAPAAPVAEGAKTVTAPMPGNILMVNVTPGQAVKSGDVLMILEAMKMENEILAPADATVASVNVNAGQTVDSGAVLCTLN